MRLEAEAGFGRVNRRLTYERRLSTLVLASRNLANFNVQSEQCNDRCPGDVIIHIPKRASKVVAAIIMPCHDVNFFLVVLVYHIGVGSVRCSFNCTGQCESLLMMNGNERFTLFFVSICKKNDMAGLLLAISLPKRLKR